MPENEAPKVDLGDLLSEPAATDSLNAEANSESASWMRREAELAAAEERQRISRKRGSADKRELWAKTIIHLVILANIGLAGLCIAASLIVRTVHLLSPKCGQWLKPEQIEQLDTLAKFAVSGAVGSLLTRYLNKNASADDSEERAAK